MQSPKIGMIKLHLFLQKRVFTARAMIMYLSIYMYLIIVSSFAKSGTDITHLNQHARPGLTAYVGIDNKIMKYVNCNQRVNVLQRFNTSQLDRYCIRQWLAIRPRTTSQYRQAARPRTNIQYRLVVRGRKASRYWLVVRPCMYSISYGDCLAVRLKKDIEGRYARYCYNKA